MSLAKIIWTIRIFLPRKNNETIKYGYDCIMDKYNSGVYGERGLDIIEHGFESTIRGTVWSRAYIKGARKAMLELRLKSIKGK